MHTVRKISKNKQGNYFPLHLFQFRVVVCWNLSWQHQEDPPWTRHPSMTGQLTHRLWQFRLISSPCVHIFGIWEETRVPRVNPHRHQENGQNPQRQSPWLGINFFSSHHHHNKTMCSKMTLLEDLLSSKCQESLLKSIIMP